MKAKILIAVAMMGAVGLSAHAGVNIGFSFGFPAPVVAVAPVCSAPVVVAPPVCTPTAYVVTQGCPGPNYVWVAGCWSDGPYGRVWVPGAWRYQGAPVVSVRFGGWEGHDRDAGYRLDYDDRRHDYDDRRHDRDRGDHRR